MQENILQEIGINAGLIVSGLFGSLLTIRQGAAARVGSIAVSITAGVGSANYITPIVVEYLEITNQSITFGIAFILGFLGLSGIEYGIKKFVPDAMEVNKRKRPAKKKKAKRQKGR